MARAAGRHRSVACAARTKQAGQEIWRIIRCAGQRRGFALGQLGANPCKPMLRKLTVATVPFKFTSRLAATGNGANRPAEQNGATVRDIQINFSFH